jgi:acetyl/propionyl-CoA carboxylase alpha subunit
MRVEIEVGGRVRVVAIEHRGKALVVSLDGVERVVDAVAMGDHRWSLRFPDSGAQHAVVVTPGREPGSVDVLVDGLSIPARLRQGGRDAAKASGGPRGAGKVTAPMPGKVVKVLVTVGQQVTARQGVAVVEAMKMENELRAGRDGTVRAVLVAEGASVDAGTPLVVIE